MATYVQKKAVFPTTLAADVANNGTFTISYPTGFVQGNFSTGQALAAYMITNDNNRYSAAASQISVSFGSTNVTVTNLTGQTIVAGTKVLLDVNVNDGPVEFIQIPVDLVSVTANGDIAVALSPGVNGYIEYCEFMVSKPVTTAAKLATLTPKVNSTLVTGGAVALTSANATPVGKVVIGSAVTANNRINASDTLSLTASGVTAFAEGQGVFNVRIRQDNPNAY